MCLPKHHWKRGRTQHIGALHSDAFSTIKVWNGKLSLNFAIICHKVFWPWFFCDFFLADLFSAEFYSAYFSFSLHFFWQLFLGRLFRQLFGCFILPPFFCQFFSGRLFSANFFWANLKVSNNQYVFFRDNDEICFDFLHHLPGGKWLLPISKLTLFK